MYHLLIAEDIEIIRNMLLNSIDWSNMGVTFVAAAENGNKALEMMESQVPDILITDIRMPILDGFRLIIATQEKYPDVKSIILTAHSDFNYAQNAIKLGVVDFIVKPIDIDELEKAVKKAVKQIEDAREGKKQQERARELMSHSFPNLAQDRDLLNYQGTIKNKKIVESAMQYMKENSCSNLTVEAVAMMVGLSSKYMTTLFKQETGESISKYIIRCKLEKAAELLRDPSIKVYEVCNLIGYSDQNYFRDIFIKYFGMNPSEYKNSVL